MTRHKLEEERRRGGGRREGGEREGGGELSVDDDKFDYYRLFLRLNVVSFE